MIRSRSNAELLERMSMSAFPPSEKSGTPQQENVGVTDMSMPSLGLAGEVAGTVGQYGLSKAGHVPGMSSVVGSGLSSIASGTDADKAIMNAISSGATDLAGNLLDKLAPGFGHQLAGFLSAGLKSPENMTASLTSSGLKSLAGMLGNMGLPGFGGLVASAIAGPAIDKSLAEGYLGDFADSRKHEAMRDEAERLGASVDETSSMSLMEDMNNAFGAPSRQMSSSGAVKADFGSPTGWKDNVSISPSLTQALENSYLSTRNKETKKATGLTGFLEDMERMQVEAKRRDTFEDPGPTEREQLSHELSTTQGAQDYGERMGKNFDDADTAMSEARGLAGLDSIGGLDGRGEAGSSSGSSPGDLGNDDAGEGGGGWW